MKYTIHPMTRFKKDLKIAQSRGYNISLINQIIKDLADDKILDPKYKDHELHGTWSGYRECHILPDWLLIYKKDGNELILYLTRTGTHSDLF